MCGRLLCTRGQRKVGTHSKLSLLINISDDRKAVLMKRAVELPLVVVLCRLVMVPISHVQGFGAASVLDSSQL
ncbi:hypothetical protein V6N13_036263 [Hibiscus sabdariffa]